jgi:hypothetical protein
MIKHAMLCAALFAPLYANAADEPSPAGNDQDINTLREKVQQLEQRVNQLPSNQPAARTNTFNPDIALILSGTYGNLQRDPAIPATGFAMSPNDSGYVKGFSLQESELSLTADIDPQFRGVGTLSLAPTGGLTAENAFVQTTTLGNGFNLKFGRYFSGLGYLNDQHSHTWDFVDQPLVYRTFWDNQLGEDGVQLKWLAPTDTFIELGAELGSGRGFPGSDPQKNGAGSSVLFLHVGDDIGYSNSWRLGTSFHQTHEQNWMSNNVPDLAGTAGGVTDSFSGNVHTAGVDFVWKYAPGGDTTVTNFKFQSEYFRRTQSGLLIYDTTGLTAATNTTSTYALTQSGWYAQGVYQFMPNWRAGLRYDRLNPGNAQVGAPNAANVISNYGYPPSRSTLMVDYNPSEFSRLRLQFAQDRSRQNLTDNQVFLQYIMSLGAHGAHQF